MLTHIFNPIIFPQDFTANNQSGCLYCRSFVCGVVVWIRWSAIIMRQLGGSKCSFLCCLGMSILICSVIYLRTRMPSEPRPLEPPLCRPFSTHCKSILPGMEEEGEWYRHGCQVCWVFFFFINLFYSIVQIRMSSVAARLITWVSGNFIK